MTTEAPPLVATHCWYAYIHMYRYIHYTYIYKNIHALIFVRMHFSVRKRLLWIMINIEFNFGGLKWKSTSLFLTFVFLIFSFCLYGCFNIVNWTFEMTNVNSVMFNATVAKYASRCKMSSIQWGETVSLVQHCAFVAKWTWKNPS